jgi:hypothetical protein
MIGPNFTQLHVTELYVACRPDITPAKPIVITADDARQGEGGNRMLYVLCFGVAGAIIANAIIFLCFTEFGVLG